MAYSKQREAILSTVKSKREHMSADEVYASLKREHPALSLGTVYRNLNFLSEMGKIKKISIPGCADRFDGVMDDHCHLYCIDCSQLVDMEAPEALQQLGGTQPPEGCEVLGAHLLFYGRCEKCAAKNHG